MISWISCVGDTLVKRVLPYLWSENKVLGFRYQALKQETEEKDKIIQTQNEIINATHNTKPSDINGLCERMRDNKL